MTTKLGALAFSVALISPLTALAQDYSGGLTLGYGKTDMDLSTNGSGTTMTLDGRVEVAFEGGFSFGARFSQLDKEDSLFPISTPGQLMSFELGYSFAGNFKAAAFHENFALDFEPPGSKLSDFMTIKTTGLELGYEGHGFDVSIFMGDSKMGGVAGIGFGVGYDLQSSGIRASYTFGDKLTIGASVVTTEWEAGGTKVLELESKGIAAIYNATDKMSFFAGVAIIDKLSPLMTVSNTFQDRTTGIGGTYDLTSHVGMPMIASLELVRSKSAVTPAYDTESVRLGLSIPLGKGHIKAPLNSTADAILNPARSGYSQAHLSF